MTTALTIYGASCVLCFLLVYACCIMAGRADGKEGGDQ
jgi:hypothetical protein